MLGLSLFLYNDPRTPGIYTLSLHDALPISAAPACGGSTDRPPAETGEIKATGGSSTGLGGSGGKKQTGGADRKSTRLNSSHVESSYAGVCLKKKKQAW